MQVKQLQYNQARLKFGAQSSSNQPLVNVNYMSKDQRLAKMKEQKSANFSLGNKEPEPTPLTQAQEQFKSQNFSASEVEKARQKMAQARLKSRQSNFTISQDPVTSPVKDWTPQNYFQTYSQQTFSPKQKYEKDQSSKNQVAASVANLRKVNLTLGTDKVNYESTNTKTAHDFQQNLPEKSAAQTLRENREDQQERRLKARTAQFQIGRNNLNYQTTANVTFVSKDMSNMKASALERQANGVEVRKAHYKLSYEQGNGNQNFLGKPTSYEPVNAAVPATENNIQIGHQGVAQGQVGDARFVSTQKQAQELHKQPEKLSYKNQQQQMSIMKEKTEKENVKKPQDKNRLSNFQVGNEPGKLSYETSQGTSYQAYADLKPADSDARLAQKSKMQKAQFHLAVATNGQPVGTSSKTTYRTSAADYTEHLNSQDLEGDKQDMAKKLRQTNITMGNDKFGNQISSSTAAFVPPDQIKNSAVSKTCGQNKNAKDLILEMKTPHFTFKEIGPQTNYYKSVNQERDTRNSVAKLTNSQDFGGYNPGEIRGRVEANRTTHFKFSCDPNARYEQSLHDQVKQRPHTGYVGQQRPVGLSQSLTATDLRKSEYQKKYVPTRAW